MGSRRDWVLRERRGRCEKLGGLEAGYRWLGVELRSKNMSRNVIYLGSVQQETCEGRQRMRCRLCINTQMHMEKT